MHRLSFSNRVVLNRVNTSTGLCYRLFKAGLSEPAIKSKLSSYPTCQYQPLVLYCPVLLFPPQRVFPLQVSFAVSSFAAWMGFVSGIYTPVQEALGLQTSPAVISLLMGIWLWGIWQKGMN